MSYALYSFTPETLRSEGYAHRGVFETEQECNDEVFALGLVYYRIEMSVPWGSVLVYETPFELPPSE